jgi:tetratricopeptide (TPR) repeat protein
MGIIELNRRNYPGAIEAFKKAVSLLPHPDGFLSDNSMFWFYLAQAYEGSGELKAARDELEKIIAFIPGRIQCGDYHAESYYRLGRIYEKLGDADKAIENHEKFLDLWKDADPGLPEVTDAKERLAKLHTN